MRAVLTYHSIDDSGSPISVSPEAFTRHVRWLTSGHVTVEPLDALVRLTDIRNGPPHRVALTFDDGFVNFSASAWPQLRDAGLPATVFLVSGHVGGTNAWGGQRVPGIPVLPLMSWDEAGHCASEGANIGAHSRTHPHLPAITASDARAEMEGGRQDLCNRLGVPVSAFAYPYGDVSPAVAATAMSTFDVACTTEYRALSGDDLRHLVPRIDMYYFQASDALADWGTLAFRRRVARRRALRAVRQGLSALSFSSSRRAPKGL